MDITKKIMEKVDEMSDFEYFDIFGETKEDTKRREDFEETHSEQIEEFEKLDDELSKIYKQYCAFYDEYGLNVYCLKSECEEIAKRLESAGFIEGYEEKHEKYIPSIVDMLVNDYRKEGVTLECKLTDRYK